MNKVITLAALALAGTTATFADRAASFGPEQSAKQAPSVERQAVSAAAKSSGRTALQIEGLKQADTAYGQSVSSAVKSSGRVPLQAQGIKQADTEGRQNAGFKFSSLVADVELPEWASRFGI